MSEEIDTISEGKAKDLILEYSLKNTGKMISSNEIQRELFPDSTEDEVEFLLKKIDSTVDEVANVIISEYSSLISATGITKIFLEQGGFTCVENEKKEKAFKESQLAVLELEKAKVDLELAKKMLKEYPRTKWIARIGFIIGIGLAILELIKYLT